MGLDTNVKGYSDQELLDRVASLDGFKGYPDDYWMIGISSNENEANVNDDKFYLFRGTEFIKVMSGTTNSGTYGLKNFKKWNPLGCFVIKTDQIIYDFWKTNQRHKGKMDAWRQNKPCHHYRDDDMDNIAEEQGRLYFGMCGINFHTQIYNKTKRFIRQFIGAWSVGCQCPNDVEDYYETLATVDPVQDTVTYAILKEF